MYETLIAIKKQRPMVAMYFLFYQIKETEKNGKMHNEYIMHFYRIHGDVQHYNGSLSNDARNGNIHFNISSLLCILLFILHHTRDY